MKIVTFILLLLNSLLVLAQTEVDERAVIHFDKGLGFFAPDSVFGLNLRFRMQNRIGMTTVSGKDLSPSEFEANVRRLRLRFDGYVGKSGFTYYLQLSFSRGDQEWDATHFPGIVRDAMVFYNFSDKFYMGMGQGKLPGNRQRVVSSGQQQFADRSLVNAIFNIDRDFGLMAYYSNALGGMHYNLKGAISSGEGRNIQKTDKGLAYTSRVEVMPFGRFKSDGDFSEGDLLREATPKLSIGSSYAYNHRANRASGQRGEPLADPTNIQSLFVDMIAKYQGWALQSEYARREVSRQPEISQEPGGPVYVYTGDGLNTQLSYVFRNMVEVAGRYTWVHPGQELRHLEPRQKVYTAGISKYLSMHRNKLQLNVSYQENDFLQAASKNFWNIMLQVEIGI